MKKTLFIVLSLMLSAAIFAQNKDVTKFLGIPVDGTKTEMISKLKAKGFVANKLDAGVLDGEFNGHRVNVHVVTNNRKVYRIMVADVTTYDETEIKIRFNNLCRQFANNPKYLSTDIEQVIPDDESISIKMFVDKKRYEASFMQYTKEEIDSFLNSQYTEEQLKSPTDDMQRVFRDFLLKKSVWFMINKSGIDYGKYNILMYYDNGYNKANGEDL